MGNSFDKSGQFVERGLGRRRAFMFLIIAAFAALVALLPWVRPAGAAAGQPTKSSKAVARPTRAWAI